MASQRAAKRSLPAEEELATQDQQRDRSVGLGLNATWQLNDGRHMPQVGFGVYRVSKGEPCYKAVRAALAEGYRMIDTAKLYRNEADVGRAIRDSGVPRSEVFVTTKVWDSDHGFEEAFKAGRQSVERIGLGYVDLLLIHSPGRRQGRIVETYDALLALQKEGLVRSVGVSNFGSPHLDALAVAGRPTPVVNQIEMHPLVCNESRRRAAVEYCALHGIIVTAYGSIFSGQRSRLSEEPVVSAARAHGKTPAQVLLRWGLQKGFQVIPKSVHEERVRENAKLFDFALSEGEVAALDQMTGDLDEYWNPLGWPVDLGDVSRGARSR